MKSKTIAIIPARGGSKRIPDKNRILFAGAPLVLYSIRYAEKNEDIIDALYISTDYKNLGKELPRNKAIVIKRPDEISGDFEPTVTALQHVLATLNDPAIENVVLLQPTSPLRPEELLKDCFEKFINENADSLFTVSTSHKKLGNVNNGKYEPFNYEIGQRSQDLAPLYYENGLLYITKASLIMEGKIISENAIPYVTDHIFASVDIDTMEDVWIGSFLAERYGMTINPFNE